MGLGSGLLWPSLGPPRGVSWTSHGHSLGSFGILEDTPTTPWGLKGPPMDPKGPHALRTNDPTTPQEPPNDSEAPCADPEGTEPLPLIHKPLLDGVRETMLRSLTLFIRMHRHL